MKPRCRHTPVVVRTEDLPNRRIYHTECSKCHRKGRRSRKLVLACYDQPKPPKTRQKPQKRQRKAIPRMSKSKAEWESLYWAQKASEPAEVTGYNMNLIGGVPSIFSFTGIPAEFERHHVFRRHNWQILLYRHVTHRLHEWIESNSARAREMGLLFNVERGELRNPSQNDPFGILPEFEALKAKYQP